MLKDVTLYMYPFGASLYSQSLLDLAVVKAKSLTPCMFAVSAMDLPIPSPAAPLISFFLMKLPDCLS